MSEVEEQEHSYRMWAAEQLISEIRGEEDRRRWLDKKANTQWAGLAVLTGAVAKLNEPVSFSSFAGVFFAGGCLLVLVALYLTLKAREIRTYKRMAASQFMSGHADYLPSQRLEVVIIKLGESLEATRREVSAIAKGLQGALVATGVATGLLVASVCFKSISI